MQKLVAALIAVALVLFALSALGVLDSGSAPASLPSETALPESPSGEVSEFEFEADSVSSSPETAGSSAVGAAPSGAAETPGSRGVIRGKVVDEEGRPLVAAVLHLRASAGPVSGGARTPDLEDPEQRIETAEDGTFAYEGLETERTYRLFARASGKVGERHERLRPDGEPLTIALVAGVIVEGQVVDPTGRPASFASVRSGPTMQEWGAGLFVPSGWGEGDESLIFPVSDATESGSFRLEGIPVGEFSLVANHEEWAPSRPVNLMQSQARIVLELRPGSGAFGIVRDSDGVPIEGATVAALNPFTRLGGDGTRLGSTVTDRQGRYELSGLPPEQLVIRAEAEGFTRVRRDLRVEEGEQKALDLVMDRGASIRGRVVDLAGAPIEGAAVVFAVHGDDGPGLFFTGESGVAEFPGRNSTTTGADGAFLLEGVPSRSRAARSLRVDHNSHALWTGEPFDIEAGEEVLVGDIVLAEAWTVRGTIRDERGEPIESASVALLRGAEAEADTGARQVFSLGGSFGGEMVEMVRSIDAPPLSRTSTDAAGRYTLRVEELGEYRVEASRDSYQKQTSEPFVVGDASVSGMDLVLPPALWIAGTVVDELGVPCAEIEVSAEGKGGATTDENGAFLLDGLDDRDYALSLSGEGWTLAGEGPHTYPAGSEGVELVARRPGQVLGRITDATTGLPVPVFSLNTRRQQKGNGFGFFMLGGMGGTEYRDPDGQFLLERAAGEYTLTVRSEGYVDSDQTEVEVFSARETLVDIQLTPAGSIIGRVLDSRGDPIVGARVSAVRLREDGTEEPPRRNSGGLGIEGISIAINTDGGSSDGIVLTAGGPFGGGDPITDDEGRFRVVGLEDGDYKVTIRSSAYRERSEAPIAVETGRASDAGDLELERGSAVSGAVLPPSGRSLLWGNIVITGADGTEKSSQVGPDGSYTIGGLASGEYTARLDYMLQPVSADLGGLTLGNAMLSLGEFALDPDEERTLDVQIPAEETP